MLTTLPSLLLLSCCCFAVKSGSRTLSARLQSNACFNCGDRAHGARDCPHPPTCLACGQPGHKFASCPNAAPKAALMQPLAAPIYMSNPRTSHNSCKSHTGTMTSCPPLSPRLETNFPSREEIGHCVHTASAHGIFSLLLLLLLLLCSQPWPKHPD